MSNDPHKLQEEEETPQEQTEQGVDFYGYRLGSIAGQIEAQKTAYEAQLKQQEQFAQDMRDARAKRNSLMGSIIEKQRPQYDENKEKRMRAAATIQALGDVLSAATKGAIAYGKKGAGVVPAGVPSNAMEGVAKINEMQQKYLQERKAWEDLVLNWENQKAMDDIAAAEALYTQGQAKTEKELAALKALQDKYEGYEDMLYKEYRDEAKHQQQRVEELEDYEKKAQITRKYAVRTGGDTAPKKQQPQNDDDLINIYLRYNKQIKGGKAMGVKDYTATERKALLKNAQEHPRTLLHWEMLEEGAAPIVIEALMSRIDDGLAKEIIGAYYSSAINSGISLYDYALQYENTRAAEHKWKSMTTPSFFRQ